MKTSNGSTSTPEAWLPELLHAANVTEATSMDVLQERMDKLAESAAPLARSWWKWMVLIEALSVLAPALWLMRRPLNISPAAAALATFAAVIIFIVALWWMRWRGMRRTWARARLVAEVARSQISAAVCPVLPTRRVLNAIPAIQSLLKSHDASRQKAWPEWRQDWIADRVDGQLNYYCSAKKRSEDTRQQFTRWATLFMDVMLALGAAGVVITLSDRAPQWLRILGDYRIEFFLGVAGILLALGIILIQSLRHLQEVNRRTARFERQITMLERAKRELSEAATPEEAIQIVEATEDQLLGEVVDWYFEAETAENYFQVREIQRHAKDHFVGSQSIRQRFAHLAWVIGGVGLLFVCRVLLGRAPWVVGASALTLGWLSYSSPTDPVTRSRLHGEGTLVDEQGKPWNPDPLRSSNGCIIIAHGLHDGATVTAEGVESRWMRDISQALQVRLAGRLPNIGLVDWATAAAPTSIHSINAQTSTGRFIGDLAGIPSQAREVGDFLAFRLAQLILEKRIDTSAPLHLIGHSAGGFLVARAALILRKMNLAPATMHVTILDTPAPDDELLVEVPKACAVDFYITSPFVRGLDENQPPEGVYLKQIVTQEKLSLLEAHSYAYKWFIETIKTAKMGETGFGRSPFAQSVRDP